MKRVAFTTFGCRLNQYDTETVRTLMEGTGNWRSVSAHAEADVYVVNTCSVTSRADATARKAIRRIHRARPNAQIVVTGCYAQRAPEEIAELDGVALILGAADRGAIVENLTGLRAGSQRVVVSAIQDAKVFLDIPITEMMEHSRAFVKVQEGCNEACSFCIVPQTRGSSRSRSPESVLSQVRGLIASGYVEIVLTGVHLGDYGVDLGSDNPRLTELIRQILEIPGLQRFRLSSIEPSSIGDELIELMAGEDKFARHFHIPFQSGSNEILARMRRRYSLEQFSNLVERIARKVPGCGLGADVICGFPGETDAHFQQTFDYLTDAPITYLHPFSYSERPGSEAATFSDQIAGDVKKRRVRSLKRLMRDKSRAFRETQLHQTVPVLLECTQRDGVSRLSGWTDNYIRVDLGEGTATASVEEVHITAVTETGLSGTRLRAA